MLFKLTVHYGETNEVNILNFTYVSIPRSKIVIIVIDLEWKEKINDFNTCFLTAACPQKLYNSANTSGYTKDAIHRYVISRETEAVNPLKRGTKVAAHFVLTVPSGGQRTIRCRLSALDHKVPLPFSEKTFDSVMYRRKKDADEFYKTVIPGKIILKNCCAISCKSDVPKL